MNFRGLSNEDVVIKPLIEQIVAIARGEVFPHLERLHLKWCRFNNEVVKALLVDNEKPLSIQKIDIMDSRSLNLEPIATSLIGKHIEFCWDGNADDQYTEQLGSRLRQGIDVLPY